MFSLHGYELSYLSQTLYIHSHAVIGNYEKLLRIISYFNRIYVFKKMSNFKKRISPYINILHSIAILLLVTLEFKGIA